MDKDTSQPDAGALSQFREFLEGCSGRTKWASVNAISHIQKSIEIAELDPVMAAFRAVCAEEEAATALIGSIKEQAYDGSDKLYFRNHADKHAVILFVGAVMQWFQNRKIQAADVFGKHRIFFDDVGGRVGLRLGIQLGQSDKEVQPTPPLNLISSGGLRTLGEQFQAEMKELLGLEKTSEIKKLIEQRANFRNTMLYATPLGVPKSTGNVNSFINNQIGIVNSLLIALALIDPWRAPDYQKSGIVTASIKVFIDLMERVNAGRSK
ncbi:hypothetical protein [Pseudomonas peradeniyensis]|uniref:Uncharacterized protein n=1 Tax=Pseudomonas peradeniyensis TaxID=2745488 RepID=A0ABT2VFR7_9PSED|nr:hypothetical protein [Pseudomonas peradeniyensis]MCU7240376.1 hypothetical protein [Pseudomonas peradeniyensis]